ncbi:MAG: DNA topoisomerase [Lachnospiraceae bacterium]
MGKSIFIAEKPSVAAEFAKALKVNTERKNGYLEGSNIIVTWCVGHLVTMSYPDSYDPALKKWSIDTLPFLPEEYLYEVIPSVSKQFDIVSSLLNRQDVDTIYVCTDSGREGEYIYRLVDNMARVPADKERRRVWIDSQTEEEILRGIKEAKPLSAYDNLSDAAYLRAKEDYLMGINFSRVLTLKYGNLIQNALQTSKWSAISVGRVMTCVLGIVVRREREIRDFVKTPFYKISALMGDDLKIEGFFKAVESSKYFASNSLYKDVGFLKLENAREFVSYVGATMENPQITGKDKLEKYQENYSCNKLSGFIDSIEKKDEKKNPPMLFNLAELQNECSQSFKISPDETLKIVQELYEKKLVTYPRTDARVMSSAVAKEITKNISGVGKLNEYKEFTDYIINNKTYQGIEKTKYVNDSQITDHYAIIPTGQGFSALSSLSNLSRLVYDKIVRRFLSVFFPSAVFKKISLSVKINGEVFQANFKTLKEPGYLNITGQNNYDKSKDNKDDKEDREEVFDSSAFERVNSLKKGMSISINSLIIKEGETAPPKRYNSGSLILTMEKAGQFIEDEELRAQIKGSGIGTSATRAEILNKLFKINYLSLNSRTQIITPTLLGEMVYEVVYASIKSLLNADLTASWEKGLNYVAEGQITKEEYMKKLEEYITKWTNQVKHSNNSMYLKSAFSKCAQNYKSVKR